MHGNPRGCYTKVYTLGDTFSWNEWSEGGYLEPDMKNQYGYLDAIKSCVDELESEN